MNVGDDMNTKQKILQILKENKGILLTSQVDEAGLGRWALKELVNENELISVQRGVYVSDEGYADDFFLLQKKYPKGIYSHETALYLHGFSERIPARIVMTFEHGVSTSRMKNDNIQAVVTTKEFVLGMVLLQRPGGTAIRIYDLERTIVDLLKPKYDTDYEQLIPAFKRYAIYSNKDINKLYRYARIFKVEERIRNYMGVLL
jgi:predicted transcriptional regulator of viral defense system